MIKHEQILELITQKNPKGLEALYDAYGRKFYTYSVFHWYLNEDEAWDVVYKTLETLVLKLANYEFESKAHFDNFLYKVLINFLRQHFRQSRAQNKGSIEYVNIDDEGTDLSVQIDTVAFSNYYQSETAENPKMLILNECLNKLDSFDKDLLLLRAQNYTYDEIAALLGVANNQLKVKHLRAKQKLVNLINETQNI